MLQKLSNYTLHKAAQDGFCVEIIQNMVQFDRKQKCHRHCLQVSPKLDELLGDKFGRHFSNKSDFSIADVIEIQIGSHQYGHINL